MDMVADETFDVVILECVFGFIKNKQKAVQQIFRVLKPGGSLAITDFYYKSQPSEIIVKGLISILGIKDLLTKSDWHNFLSGFRLDTWQEIKMATGEISVDTIRTMLINSTLYDKFPFGEEGLRIVANILKRWNNVFSENRKYMSGFNGVFRKLE